MHKGYTLRFSLPPTSLLVGEFPLPPQQYNGIMQKWHHHWCHWWHCVGTRLRFEGNFPIDFSLQTTVSCAAPLTSAWHHYSTHILGTPHHSQKVPPPPTCQSDLPTQTRIHFVQFFSTFEFGGPTGQLVLWISLGNMMLCLFLQK